MMTTFDTLALKHAPWLAPLANCPDVQVQANGDILVDCDNPCLKALFDERLTQPPKPDPGTAGTHSRHILGKLGVKVRGCGSCEALAAQMDLYGDAWCIQHRDRIVRRLQRKMDELKPREMLAATMRGIAKAMAFIDPEDIAGSIFDEAVRRSNLDRRRRETKRTA
jgi:hypothetical protein